MPDNPLDVIKTPDPPRPVGKENWTRIGDLWLRIADQRDVFYAESVEIDLPTRDMTTYRGIYKPSIGTGEKWFDGTKDEFLAIDVDVNNTIIEGFYVDQLGLDTESSYEITIYLEIDE